MIGIFECIAIAKKDPNREKDKTKFHYGLCVTSENFSEVVKKGQMLQDFRFIDFWEDRDFPFECGKKYLCKLDVVSDTYIKFLDLIQPLKAE